MRKVAIVLVVVGGGVLSGCASYLEPLNIIQPSFSYARDDGSAVTTATVTTEPIGPAIASVPTR